MATTADSVRSRTFTRTKWRQGYAPGEVDAFLERVALTLEAHPDHSGAVDADTVMHVRFSPTKFRAGYDQDEVDDFLDDVVATLRQLEPVAPGSPTEPTSRAPMTSAYALSRRFNEVRYREGYVPAEVDAFMRRVVAALAAGESGGRSQDHLSCDGVVTTRFSASRSKGYDQDEVDDFLDDVVAALRRHEGR